MRSSRAPRAAFAAAAFLACATLAGRADADGFAVERLYPSAPGGGWFVMDALDMRGSLGGAVSLTTGYSHDPYRIATSDGAQQLAVVSDRAFVDLALAITYDRFRFYLNFTSPVLVTGQTGHIGGATFNAPNVDLGTIPDVLSDARLGVDVRIAGNPKGPFRLGASAQLIAPNGYRSDYDSDETWRAMFRLLFAGDVGAFVYAGQIGVHVRPLDDPSTPGAPRGSELLFGAAAGARVPLTFWKDTALVVGPEVFGESAFNAFFGTHTTGVEGLLSGRVEGTKDDGGQLRVRVGAGAGLNQYFGAPEWRVVVGLELFDHRTDRDRDGVSDSKDACPDTPGVHTKDPRTDGCPAAEKPPP